MALTDWLHYYRHVGAVWRRPAQSLVYVPRRAFWASQEAQEPPIPPGVWPLLLAELLETHGVPHERCGALLAALDAAPDRPDLFAEPQPWALSLYWRIRAQYWQEEASRQHEAGSIDVLPRLKSRDS